MQIPRSVVVLLLSGPGLLAQGQTGAPTGAPAGARDGRGPVVQPGLPEWREKTFDKSALHAEFDGEALWVGTVFGGVYRWDTASGEYRNFTRVNDGLGANEVLDLAVHAGEVWAGHWTGLSHYDGATWTVFDSTNSPLKSATALEVAGGATWIGTFDQGLFRYDGTTWTQYTEANSGLGDDFVTSIEEDAFGNLWIGAYSAGVDRFDGSTWTRFDPGNSGLISYFVWVRATHPGDGRVWFYCHDDDFDPDVGIVLFDGTSTWEPILPPGSGGSSSAGPTASQGIHSEYIHSVVVDQDDAVWYEGLGAISRQEGASWTLFDSIPTGFDFNLPHGSALAVSASGALWAATDEGLLRYDGFDFEGHATDGLWDMDVPEVAAAPDGTTWMATRAGVHGVRNGAWVRYTTLNSPLASDDVDSVAVAPDGALLVGLALGGAARLKDGQWTTWNTANSGIHSNNVVAVAADGSGAYWFGSGIFGNAVSRLENGVWTTFTEQNSALTEGSVTRIVAEPGSDAVWFVSHAGADRFEGGAWTHHPIGAPAGDACKDVAFAPNGDVWFARLKGVSVLSGQTVTDFTAATGLAENRSNAVAVDFDGLVWVGHHDLGLSIYDGAVWTHVDASDGLTSNRVQAIDVDARGVLWFGTGINVGRFRASR